MITADPFFEQPVFDPSPNWYVARSVAGNIRSLASKFNWIKKTDLVHQAIVPVAHYYFHDQLIDEILFPGYFLIQGVLTMYEVEYVEWFFPGCKMLRNEKELPPALSADEIEHIRNLCYGVETFGAVPDFVIGDVVLPTSGPFQGIPATIKSIDARTLKTFVIFNLMGRECPVEFPASQLVKR